MNTRPVPAPSSSPAEAGSPFFSGQCRVLHLITRLDLGGSAENTLLSAIGLARKGCTVSLICGPSTNPPSRTEQEAVNAGVTIFRQRSLVRRISPLIDLWALFSLYRHLRRHPCDILHTHTSKTGIIGRVAGFLARTPCMVHTPHGHIFYGYFSVLITQVFVLLERVVMGMTHALITLTAQEKNDYLARKIGPPAKIHVITSGIDLAGFLSRPRTDRTTLGITGLSSHHFICITVARLVPVKNHACILRAAERLQDLAARLRFVFVGDGELRASLAQEAQNRGVTEMIVFAGWQDRIAEFLAAADLFVMCSRNEGLGRAFIEAQACAVPVIGSTVGGIPEALQQGETGYLVPPDDDEALANRVRELHDDPHQRERLSGNCRPWVNPRFSHHTMVADIIRLYTSLYSGTTV